jgi:hypothetical protein
MTDDRISNLEERIAALESESTPKVETKKKRKPKLPKDQRPPPKGRAKFMSEQMPKVRTAWLESKHQVKDKTSGEMRDFKQPDVMSECSRLWRDLSDEEKAKY